MPRSLLSKRAIQSLYIQFYGVFQWQKRYISYLCEINPTGLQTFQDVRRPSWIFEPSLASLWNVNSGNLGTDDVYWRRFGRHLGHAKWKLKESLTCKLIKILRNHINIHTWSIREQKRQKILQFCGSILRHQPTNPLNLRTGHDAEHRSEVRILNDGDSWDAKSEYFLRILS